MEFFHSQESLTTIQWVLRAVVTFFFMLISARIMGQRSISQLRLIDFVIALTIGNIMAHPLSDEHLGLKGSMITMTVLIILYLCTIFLILKFQGFRTLLHGQAFPLIKDSQIIYKNLSKARISLDVLLSEIRKQKVSDVKDVSLALWEPDGTISIFLKTQQQTVTKADMNIPAKPFSFPRTVIKEGKLIFHELNQLGKDEEWIKRKLKSNYNAELHQILLATMDQKETLTIFFYR
ncbi:DUF421 domain-containing protein [Niallia oryzisoli]|uniref:DUF421 domain-containing protein n=1 Tax=Niallia oryzisoli TaxID=1737571 RepID=UPI003734C81A